jgi:hypothetical protein
MACQDLAYKGAGRTPPSVGYEASGLMAGADGQAQHQCTLTTR